VNILVDTSVWSLALRRKGHLPTVDARIRDRLGELIAEGRVRMAGPIRQELLSGIRDEQQYVRLRDYLRAFPDEALAREDYEEAARVGNRCRSAGIAGSPVDHLLCAVALSRHWEIFTSDRDFGRYAKVVSVRLHEPTS